MYKNETNCHFKRRYFYVVYQKLIVLDISSGRATLTDLICTKKAPAWRGSIRKTLSILSPPGYTTY